MVMCSRPTSPPRLDARMADSPPTLSNRDPTFEIRVVVYVEPCLLGGKERRIAGAGEKGLDYTHILINQQLTTIKQPPPPT